MLGLPIIVVLYPHDTLSFAIQTAVWMAQEGVYLVIIEDIALAHDIAFAGTFSGRKCVYQINSKLVNQLQTEPICLCIDCVLLFTAILAASDLFNIG